MTFKVLFVSLLLYVALAWVGAAYLYTGPDIVHHALLWTAIGLIAILAFIILSRVLGWWRLRQAKRAAKPAAAAPQTAAAPAHPDDQALLTLIAEANAALAKSPAFAGKAGGNLLSTLPIYLLVGPEASGKTSTFLSSGLEPQLLAGQGITPVASTRLANFWLAKNALFVELSGRAFAGELTRWSQLLRLLRGQSTVSFVKKLWGQPEQQVELRGAVAFCDAKDFTSASSDPQRLEKSIRDWQERLRAIAGVFGAEFPVYVAITKCDKIPFFPDFFRRLPETEVNQVLGCTLPPANPDRSSPGEVFAEAEARRLTASFRPLYHAVAQKRLSQLAHEPNSAQRGGIYEFPRELKRIRTPVVQFLTDVFRPNTLGPGPVLRGYYLTGTRETEVALVDPAATRMDFGSGSMETTSLFRGEATQIFQTGGAPKPPAGQGRFTLKWLFVADLFHKIVLPDRLARPVQPVTTPVDRYRQFAMAGVCGLCVLLCGAFGISWGNNRGLLSGVQAATLAPVNRTNGPAPLSDLQSLDQLRMEIIGLRGHMPLSYHWGLYTGDRILPEARAAWFRRFQRVLLIDLNSLIVADLGALPTTPDANAPSDPVYRILKTHLTITSGNCSIDSGLVGKVLKTYRGRIAPGGGTDWQTLADRQIDFFAAELPAGNPARLPEDMEARDRAREYLQKIKGIDRFYANIITSAEGHIPKVASLKDTAPNYTQVLNGPEEVSAVFSKDGWTYFDKAAKESNSAILGEPCVVGQSAAGIVGALQQNTETTHALERMYIADYIQRWQKFVSGFSVLKYNGPEDAAKKLEILSDHKSPLLAVLALTANQTNFPAATAPAANANVVQQGMDKILGSLKKAESTAKAATGAPQETEEGPSTPADITSSFQPVDWVEPPGSETWVVDKNAAYMDALSQLRHSMQDIAQGGRNPDPAVHQAANQTYEKAMDTVRQIAKGFKPTGVGGLDTAVEALLEEPIRLTNPFIIRDIEKVGAQKVNGDLHSFCISQRNTFRKYPFQSLSNEDVSLDELAGFLQPANGGVWKFVQQSLGDLVVKEGSQWKSKDPSKKPQVTNELLTFLNRAQTASDVFYANGANQPQLIYTLRPKLDPSFKDTVLELEIDGKPYAWTTSLQKQFVWPAPQGTPTPGAVARLKTAGPSFPFASRPGIWGIFKIFGDAEAREPGAKVVVWKYGSGGVGRKELIQPAPVELEIVQFPGNVDVFNPKFWAGFQCPTSAVQ